MSVFTASNDDMIFCNMDIGNGLTCYNIPSILQQPPSRQRRTYKLTTQFVLEYPLGTHLQYVPWNIFRVQSCLWVLPISFRVASLTLGQSYGAISAHSAREVHLTGLDKINVTRNIGRAKTYWNLNLPTKSSIAYGTSNFRTKCCSCLFMGRQN